MTARAAFRHPMDVVVTCALSGAALSLGLSVVVQHGAFTHLQATAGDPASVALIALDPGIFAAGDLGYRGGGGGVGVAQRRRQPGGGRRRGGGSPGARRAGHHPAGALRLSRHRADDVCGVRAGRGVPFRHADRAAHRRRRRAQCGPRRHRLHGAVVAAIIAVGVMLAAGVTAAGAFSGPSTQPKPPMTGPGSGVVPTPHALGGGTINFQRTHFTLAPGGSSSNLHNLGLARQQRQQRADGGRLRQAGDAGYHRRSRLHSRSGHPTQRTD